MELKKAVRSLWASVQVRSWAGKGLPSLLIAGCFCTIGVDLIPYNQYWDEMAWQARNIQILSMAALAALWLPYSCLRAKLFFAVLAAWRLVSVSLDVTHGPLLASPVVLLLLMSLYAGFAFRSLSLEDIPKQPEPKDDEAVYYLVPVHTYIGMIQALLMPWHYGKYETRAISEGKHIWLVHRGRYKRHDRRHIDMKHAIAIPLNRYLTDKERCELNSLIGKRAIMGYRDCRKLFVAGDVDQFIWRKI